MCITKTSILYSQYKRTEAILKCRHAYKFFFRAASSKGFLKEKNKINSPHKKLYKLTYIS